MFHSSMRQGTKVLVILKTGERIYDRFKESHGGSVTLYEYGRIAKGDIDKLIVPKGLTYESK